MLHYDIITPAAAPSEGKPMSVIVRELGLTWTLTGLVIVSALGIYATVIVYSRLAGIRSHSRMSTFDFATTIAIGAVIGRVVLVRTSLLAGVVGLASLFSFQYVIAYLRMNAGFGRFVDNPPILLMAGPQLLPDGLRRAHVTPQDVYEKLRLNGVGRVDEVKAVVLERSGDISVIHGDVEVDPDLFPNVIGREQLGHGRGRS